MKEADKKRILIIEDDEHIAQGLKLNLHLKGYDIEIAGNGTAGIRMWKDWNPGLIVLDIMLPGIDGLSVLRHIRLQDEKLPVLILSAKGDAEDRVKGFACGVDDYLAKPFNLDEFLLRVERLWARSLWSSGNDVDGKEVDEHKAYTFGGNKIDFVTMMADCRRGRVQLTEQEVRLLKIFIARRGRPVSRKELLEVGWGYAGVTTTRTVDNFIVRLRRYFEDDPQNPVFFKSLRSVGYLFDHQE
ncbi:MAG: response regulator transcription factor, partial [Smithellaceae bacterium]|nr:response regulator transcription factor [Smithellaceae bacterium]